MPSLSQVTLVDTTALEAGFMTLFDVSVDSSSGQDIVDGMMKAIKTANMSKCDELRGEIITVENKMDDSVALKTSFSILVDGYIEEKEFYEEMLQELQENNGSPDDIAKYTTDIERCQKEINYNQEFIATETVGIEAY
ncbi:hypothetical protein IW139_004990, partial [Coemansia sp. RSA 353]